jgi:lipopolysaccharide transport system ATP-binding protein
VISLQAANLGKVYRIYERPIDSLKELILRRSFHEEFWALRGVDFTLPQGGSLGIIGENGAGKSTLLKLLAGTIKPTEGGLQRNGRVSAILELGSGFHEELSGEENIRLGCSVLGLSPSETESLLPEIVDFSELGEFVKRPVKTYSSGMFLRLAFSIVTSVDPDILVIDEVFAVGDQHFQKKCVDRMNSFRDEGKTLVFCSHQIYFVRQLCEQTLWLRAGTLEMLGPTIEVTDRYQSYQRALDEESDSGNIKPPAMERKESVIGEVRLGGDCSGAVIASNGRFELTVTARLEPAARGTAHLGLRIRRNDGVCCYGVSTQLDGDDLRHIEGDRYGIKFIVDPLPLLAGEYAVDLYLLDSTGVGLYDVAPRAVFFRVRQHTKELGLAHLLHRWEDPG